MRSILKIEQRRFLLKTLRDFGFGKRSMESLVMDEVVEMMKWLEKNESKPVSVSKKFMTSSVNALWSIVAGERLDHDNPELEAIQIRLIVPLSKFRT